MENKHSIQGKLFLVVLGFSLIITVGGILLLKNYVPTEQIPLNQSMCEWRPSGENYGPCAQVLGVYFNGKSCVPISGCDSGDDVIPFGYGQLEQCSSLCGGTNIQPQTIDTSTWQTYRNDEYGFEMKYPKDWKLELPSIDKKGVSFHLPRTAEHAPTLVVFPKTRYTRVFTLEERIAELLRVGDIRDASKDVDQIQIGSESGLMWTGFAGCDPGCGAIANIYVPKLVEQELDIYVTAYNIQEDVLHEHNYEFPWSVSEKEAVLTALSTFRFVE